MPKLKPWAITLTLNLLATFLFLASLFGPESVRGKAWWIGWILWVIAATMGGSSGMQYGQKKGWWFRCKQCQEHGFRWRGTARMFVENHGQSGVIAPVWVCRPCADGIDLQLAVSDDRS